MSWTQHIESQAKEILSKGGNSDVAATISIAISLKRIADALEMCDKYGQTGSAAISSAIRDGMREGK